MILFKYKHKTRKAPKKYEHWLNDNTRIFTRFSDSGFNSQLIMEEYLPILFKQVKKTYPDEKIVLVLDSASCHLGEISHILKKYNAEVVVIPGGCTSFLQPLDVAVNKPLKDRIRAFYKDWLLEKSKELELATSNQNAQNQVVTKGGVLRAPEELDIRKWFLEALKSIDIQLFKNSFINCGISFGFWDHAHLNSKISEGFSNLIEIYEPVGYNRDENPYMDSFEAQVVTALRCEEVIISQEDIEIEMEKN